MFTLCCLLKSSFYVANKTLKDCFLHVGVTHSHKQFKMAVNYMLMYSLIDHFTVVCSVTWPVNGSEAGGDLALIQTSMP